MGPPSSGDAGSEAAGGPCCYLVFLEAIVYVGDDSG
eukprot:CAMPEP_0180798736 /NCGR_PEP_ID=MMETSP1038_2-20121128/58126_1 /TAXON_ID=632150 /ORGANISM="Azadinium spinosum, Strain 3D9" /LENGTH=35 /DNA_ID= /DNA_START= /DNA_END= /DNA_ORIENTATION=